MGGCESCCSRGSHPEKVQTQKPETAVVFDPDPGETTFQKFASADLKAATHGFRPENVVSENPSAAPNVVYRGSLEDGRRIAVKKLATIDWPNPEHFANGATAIGKLRHKSLANLIGYCCDDDERLLVAEYMPHQTLSQHLFHWTKHTLEWKMRLKVALYIAEALDYCNGEGLFLYHNLNADKVLFDEDGNPRLSCFGLLNVSPEGKIDAQDLSYMPPEYHTTGRRMTPEIVIYRFGLILLNLLSGKKIPSSHALGMILKRNLEFLMDSHLLGQFSTHEATTIADLATRCLQSKARDRPSTKDLVKSLAILHTESKVSPLVMLGVVNTEEVPRIPERPLSRWADACSRMDLMVIHQILVNAYYTEDQVTNELSFQEWTPQIRNMLDARKQGDNAFEGRDFQAAINYYSQYIDVGTMVSPTVFVRRSLCHLLCDQPDAALGDAIRAQCVYPEWPTALYMQSVALKKLGMQKDASDILNEASSLEEKQKGQKE